MAVSPSYQSLVLDQLSRAVPAIRARRMFGAVGIYSEEAFFAVIAEDTLYFKVDAATQPEFEARGMPAFRPFGEEGAKLPYFQVPEEVFDDLEELRHWAQRAIAVVRRKKRRGGSRGGA